MMRRRRHAQVPPPPIVQVDAVGHLTIAEAPKTSIPHYLSAPTVARILDVSVGWIRQWHKTGLLHGHVLRALPHGRGRLLFRESDVAEFLRSRGLPVGGDDPGDAA